MPNQDNSQPTPASSGVVAPDWEEFVRQMGDAFEGDQDQIKAAKAIFYTAYLCCYNRLMQALREPQPAVVALVTTIMRDELNKYFTSPEN
jgi:hypothetical protein